MFILRTFPMCQRYLCVCFLLLLVPLVCEAGTSLLSLVDVLELLANDRLAAEKVLNALDAYPSAGGFLPPEKRQRFLEALTAGKKNLPERFPVLTVSEMNQ